jgi:hypothetical protein
MNYQKSYQENASIKLIDENDELDDVRNEIEGAAVSLTNKESIAHQFCALH